MDHHLERNPKATIADAFGFAVTAFFNNALLLIGVELAIWGVALVCAGLGVLTGFGTYGVSRMIMRFPLAHIDIWAVSTDFPVALSLSVLLFIIVWMVIAFCMVGALYLGALRIALDIVDTGTSSFNRVFTEIHNTPAFFVTAFIKTIAISIGFALFIVPGIYLKVIWFFAFYVLIAENSGPITALRNSAVLVCGRWWQVAGFVLVSEILWWGGYQVILFQLIIAPIVWLSGAYYYRALTASLVSQRS